MTIATLTAALTAKMADLGTALSNRFKGGGKLIGPSYTAPAAVVFSTTPVFDAALSNVFHFGLMTNNVPGATITNGHDGQIITIRFQQDVTGGHSFTLPGNVFATGALSVDPSDVSLLVLTYNNADGRWEGSWTVIAL